MKTALTLGKYAPLHRGHQAVIERALAEADHVVVMVYDAPSVTTVPLPVRARWIRKLYPDVEVIEAWDGPEETGETPAIKRLQEDYLLERLDGRRITHFYCSEFYGEHISQALDATDCRVDPDRTAVPISATEIRRDPFQYRHFLDPAVYDDLVARVVLLGAPSTGKTTLAQRLAERFNTRWMPEYGREYWAKHHENRRLTPEQLVEIAEEHRQREDALAGEARHLLFVDTDATTTRMFAIDYHGTADPRLEAMADACRDRYDLFILCGDDIPYDATEDRSGLAHRTIQQKRIRADLLERGTPFVSLEGSLEQRLAKLDPVLRDFDKHAPLVEQLGRLH